MNGGVAEGKRGNEQGRERPRLRQCFSPPTYSVNSCPDDPPRWSTQKRIRTNSFFFFGALRYGEGESIMLVHVVLLFLIYTCPKQTRKHERKSSPPNHIKLLIATIATADPIAPRISPALPPTTGQAVWLLPLSCSAFSRSGSAVAASGWP